MKNFKNYIGQYICVEILGNIQVRGLLVETGSDVIILFNGKDFTYVPLFHIDHLFLDDNNYKPIDFPAEIPLINESNPLSVRKILNNSKGLFSEISVTSDQSIHGYVTNIMNDYFVFYSPIYQTMYISLQHLKWLVPYQTEQVPYSLDRSTFTSYPSTLSLARSLDEQIKKLFGKIVIFDLGETSSKVGQLISFKNNMLELVTARDTVTYVNARHIKAVHIPSKA